MKSFGKILIGLLVLAVIIIGGLGIYVATQFDPNEYRSLIASKVSEQMGRKLAINGPLGFSVFPGIKLSLQDVTLADADWANSKQPMVDVKQLDASLALMPLLRKQIVIEGVTLKGATVNLTKSGDKNNWSFKRGEPADEAIGKKNDKAVAESGQPVSLEVLAIDISDATLNYKDNEKLTKLVVKNLKTSLQPSQPFALTADADINGAPVKIDVKGDKLATLLSGAARFPVKGSISLATAKMNFDGEIKNPQTFGGADFKIDASGSGKDFAPLTGNPLPIGNFALKSNLTVFDTNNASLSDLNFTTGQTKINGQLKLGLKGKPDVTGELNIPTLNVADFSDKPVTPAQPQTPANNKKQSWLLISPAYAADDGNLIPAIPLPGEVLRAVNANVKLNIGEIIQDGKKIASFDGTAALSDGNLNVSPMKLEYAKNIFTGSMGIDGRGATPTLNVNLNSENLNYGELLKEMKLNDRITGTGALALQLSGSGKDLRQALGDSHGTFKLTSSQGEFDTGILFGGIGNVLSTALPNYNLPSTAHLHCADFAFTGQNGVWQTTTSAADSDVLGLQFAGDVNLATEKLNLKAYSNIKVAKAGSIVPPIKIAGAIMKPAVVVDSTGLAQSLATSAILGDKAKGMDILRGLGGKSKSQAPANTTGNACLAAVQGSAAKDSTPTTSATDQTKTSGTKLKDQIKGLKGLFGK